MNRSRPSRRSRGQRGVILLLLLIALALVMIAMGVAAPRMAQAIKRDREIEMIHRGAQYARAVQKYYRKFHRYPASIEQLENTNNIRFLRKAYTDPMSKDGKWRTVKFGDAKLGQQATGTGGILGGGNAGGLPPVVGGTLGQAGSALSQAAGTHPTTTQNPTSTFGSTFSLSKPQTGNSQTPQATSGTGQASSFGQPGQTFGGGAILGVASTSTAKGFHEYNDKSKYSDWLFIYDPNQDRGGLITGPYNPKAFVGQARPVGTPAGQINQPGSTFGTPSSFGNSGSFGNNPSPAQPGSPAPANQNPH